MVSKEIRSKTLQLREDVWQLARDSLDSREPQIYRTLVDFAERLTLLVTPHNPTSAPNNDEGKGASSTELISIHARYKGTKYDAAFDRTRVNGGRGECVLFQGEWLTASAAATRITRTNVNGWRFWRYPLDDGRVITIEGLR